MSGLAGAADRADEEQERTGAIGAPPAKAQPQGRRRRGADDRGHHVEHGRPGVEMGAAQIAHHIGHHGGDHEHIDRMQADAEIEHDDVEAEPAAEQTRASHWLAAGAAGGGARGRAGARRGGHDVSREASEARRNVRGATEARQSHRQPDACFCA